MFRVGSGNDDCYGGSKSEKRARKGNWEGVEWKKNKNVGVLGIIIKIQPCLNSMSLNIIRRLHPNCYYFVSHR